MLKAQFLRKQDLKRLSEAEKQQGRFRKERGNDGSRWGKIEHDQSTAQQQEKIEPESL